MMATDLIPEAKKIVLDNEGNQVKADVTSKSILNPSWKPKKPAPAPAVKM